MKDNNFLIIRVDEQTKKALKDRAHELRIDGGMSELVKNLINKELAQPTTLPAIQPANS